MRLGGRPNQTFLEGQAKSACSESSCNPTLQKLEKGERGTH